MLIVRIALLVLGLEALVAWCWTAGPIGHLVLAFAQLSILGGLGVAGWLRNEPPLLIFSILRTAELSTLPVRREQRLRKAA